MTEFKNKKVFITGATGGLGRQIAKTFSQAGAIVGLSGTNAEKLQKFSETISGESFTFPCNLSNQEEVENLINEVETTMGPIDVLVCNAGITKDNVLLRMKNNEWDAVLNVNLKSTFILNRNVIKKMMKRRYGRIINISSVVGFSGNPGQANYVASKAGMVGMSKSMALEVASRGITVNCIAPGFIESDMTAVLNEKQKESILGSIPTGKMGKAEDIANGILFLASEKSSYITGQTLHINGGMLMQ